MLLYHRAILYVATTLTLSLLRFQKFSQELEIKIIGAYSIDPTDPYQVARQKGENENKYGHLS